MSVAAIPADVRAAMSDGFVVAILLEANEGDVDKVLEIIHNELALSMAFCGRTQISQVDSNILLPGTFPTA